jgi:hypothetical protein
LGVKAGGADIANAAADGNITTTKEYENVTSISAYTISAFQADETVLVQNKDVNITSLVPVPNTKKGSGLYFCPQQNVLLNAKYWNYKIPKMSIYNGTQPVVKYDGFSIVPHSPNKVSRSIGRSIPAETAFPELDNSSETSSISSEQS